jgi:dolichol-phosphate mannosyltransferase
LTDFSKALIVLPTYNEADNIERMLETLQGINDKINLLVVDDNSPDGTAAIVKKAQAEKNYKNVFLIERSGKLGLGTAYLLGFKWALERDYEYIMTMDSDFSHPPEDVPLMIEKANECELVIGSRYVDGIRIINWPFRRLLLSFFASRYCRVISGIPFNDPTSGFNCFTRKALTTLRFDKIFTKGYAFQVELKYKVWALGLKACEHPIIFYERRDGQSKMTSGVILESVITVFKLRIKKMLGTLNG